MSPTIPARRLRGAWGTAGFTLIELMIVMAILAVLAAVAFPAYDGQVRKSRRADAITRISQIQQAQERWRANNSSYGTLANIGVPATTAGGYYTVSVSSESASSYEANAQASGAQTRDTTCIFMRATAASGAITLASGPTGGYGNGTSANNRCWNR